MEAFHAFLKFLFWAIGTRARAEYFSCGAANSIIQGGSNFFCFCVKSLRCDPSNENYITQLFCGAVYYAAQAVILTFVTVDEIPP